MRRTISAPNRPEDLRNPHEEKGPKRESAKDREESGEYAPSRPGGGKDRADLSIRFAIVGGGRGDEEAAGAWETLGEEGERDVLSKKRGK